MADLATLQTDLANIEAALSEFKKTGIIQYTMPDGRHVVRDIEQLLEIKRQTIAEINAKNKISPFSYAIPRRAT